MSPVADAWIMSFAVGKRLKSEFVFPTYKEVALLGPLRGKLLTRFPLHPYEL